MNILCPICNNVLFKQDNTYKCSNKHNFDIAKQGYVNLNMHNSQNSGDNDAMINARDTFLKKGYFEFLLNEINKHINANDSLVDLACGQGYYTSRFVAKDKIGVDLSKHGLKIASKNDKSSTYLLNSIFHNPLEDNSADKIITIFAPIAKEEIVRILKNDGQFILVRPSDNHLLELKNAIYDKSYLNDNEDISIEGLKHINTFNISKKELLKHDDIINLFMMTPYVNTTSKKDKDKLDIIEELEITFSFIIDIYSK